MSITSRIVNSTTAGLFIVASTFSTASFAYSNQIHPYQKFFTSNQLTELQETVKVAEDIWASLTSEFVSQYESGQYEQAAVTAQTAYDLAEKSFGFDNINTADSLLKLGIINDSLGNTAEAKEDLIGALTILDEQLGPDHLDVAVVLTNLANVYFEEGNNAKSESYHLQALKIREKKLGTHDATVAQSMYNLAVLYDDMQDYDKAAGLYNKSIDIWKDTLGTNHPYVANALNNLANVYVVKGEFKRATELHKQSLTIRRKVYGNNHPEVARAMINLASLYVKENDYDDAQKMYEQAVALSEKLLGPKHPQVGMLLYSLANVYHIQGRMRLEKNTNAGESGEIQKAAYTGGTGKVQNSKAQAYFKRALPLYERALAIFDKSMDSDHPALTAMLNELALLYKSVGKNKKAERVMLRLSHLQDH
jgi:tetratricopeptide (TPR) repeat protein